MTTSTFGTSYKKVLLYVAIGLLSVVICLCTFFTLISFDDKTAKNTTKRPFVSSITGTSATTLMFPGVAVSRRGFIRVALVVTTLLVVAALLIFAGIYWYRRKHRISPLPVTETPAAVLLEAPPPAFQISSPVALFFLVICVVVVIIFAVVSLFVKPKKEAQFRYPAVQHEASPIELLRKHFTGNPLNPLDFGPPSKKASPRIDPEKKPAGGAIEDDFDMVGKSSSNDRNPDDLVDMVRYVPSQLSKKVEGTVRKEVLSYVKGKVVDTVSNVWKNINKKDKVSQSQE